MLLRYVALLGVLCCASITLAQTRPIAWRTDLAAAQAEAQQTGKLVLIHFWTERCGPCRLLDKNVFTLPSVANAVEANYVPVKVKAAAGDPITQAYKITRVPTDVVISPQGEVVKKFVSPATAMAYVGQTADIAASYRSRIGANYAAVAANAPFQQPNAQQKIPAQTVSTQTPAAPPQAQAMNASPERIAMTDAPAQAAPSVPQTVTPPPSVSNPYYQQQPTKPAPSTIKETPATPESTTTTQTPQVEAVQTVAVEPAAAKDQPPTQQDLPAGSPPLGFEGYCPVTMKTEWRWAPGDVQWGAIHRGRTYLFTSQANRDAFLKDPDAYSPVLDGSDPVVAVESNQSVPGTREYALQYPQEVGRFYFFSSEESLNKFWTQPEAYAQGAQRVAQRLNAEKTLVR